MGLPTNRKQCANFHFEGLTFFAGTVNLKDSSDISFHNNRFLYPAHHGMMLQRKEMRWSNSFPNTQRMTWTSNEFANSFTLLLDHGRHSRHVHIENNSFRNSNIIVWGNNGGPILQGRGRLPRFATRCAIWASVAWGAPVRTTL